MKSKFLWRVAASIAAIAIALSFASPSGELEASCVPITDPQGGTTCRPD